MFQISLKAARVNCDMSQKEVAKELGVDVSTIINWEKGKTAPRVDQLQELCRIYDVPIDRVFFNSEVRFK